MDRFQGMKSITAGSDGRFSVLVLVVKTALLLMTDIFQLPKSRYLISILGLILFILLLLIMLRVVPHYKMIANMGVVFQLSLGCGCYIAVLVAEFVPNQEWSILIAFSGIIIFTLFSISFYIRTVIFNNYVETQLEQDASAQELFTWFTPRDYDYAASQLKDPSLQERVYQLGYERFKHSLQMKVFYCIFLLETGLNRRMIHLLTQDHDNEGLFNFDTKFFFSYCKNKKQDLEQTFGGGNIKVVAELRRVRRNIEKVRFVKRLLTIISYSKYFIYFGVHVQKTMSHFQSSLL